MNQVDDWSGKEGREILGEEWREATIDNCLVTGRFTVVLSFVEIQCSEKRKSQLSSLCLEVQSKLAITGPDTLKHIHLLIDHGRF